jgi:hypothetical protein
MTKNKKQTAAKPTRNPVFDGVCLASAYIMQEGKPVGFMYREEPEEDLDSGWRFLSGDEDDAYLDNEDNYGVYDVEAVMLVDPAIKQYLKLPFGTELERKDDHFVELPPEEAE